MDKLLLRDYQQQLAEDIRAAWTRTRAVLAWLPTGGGKTELAVHFAQEEAKHHGCTLFVVDRKTLAGQTRQRYSTKYGMLTGLLRGEDSFVRGYEPAVIATVQTLRARWEQPETRELLDRITLVVLDEAHIRFKHHEAIMQYVPNARVLGLSATPLRDGLGLTFGELARGPGYPSLIDQGHLVGCRYFVPHGDDIRDALNAIDVASTGDFVVDKLSALMRERTIIGDVVETWKTKAHDRPTIAFCTDIAHSKAVCDAFLASGISSEHIDYHTDEDDRTAMFARFRRGETQVLCSITVLAVGFDEPAASCAILARPTLSTSLHIQQVGRVMRPHDGKTDALILDHAGNVLRHGKVETFKPPELSEIDARTDRKTRSDSTDCFPCPECCAILSPGQRVCPECGHEMTRRNVVDFKPGALVEHETGAARTDPTLAELRNLYLELRFIHEGRGKGRDKAAKTAYAQVLGNFKFKCPYDWRRAQPRPPSERVLNLETSWRIAWRKRKDKPRRIAANDGQRFQQPSMSDSACRACRSTETVEGPGKGPHRASLRCAHCGGFIRWLARKTA